MTKHAERQELISTFFKFLSYQAAAQERDWVKRLGSVRQRLHIGAQLVG
jgi:hypothetical protein